MDVMLGHVHWNLRCYDRSWSSLSSTHSVGCWSCRMMVLVDCQPVQSNVSSLASWLAIAVLSSALALLFFQCISGQMIDYFLRPERNKPIKSWSMYEYSTCFLLFSSALRLRWLLGNKQSTDLLAHLVLHSRLIYFSVFLPFLRSTTQLSVPHIIPRKCPTSISTAGYY